MFNVKLFFVLLANKFKKQPTPFATEDSSAANQLI